MGAWLKLGVAVVLVGCLINGREAHAAAGPDDCGPGGCPPIVCNNYPCGSPQNPYSDNQGVFVKGQRYLPGITSPLEMYGPLVTAGTGSPGRWSIEFVPNNYVTTADHSKDRSNQGGCKEDNTGDPVQISTKTKTQSIALFAIPGEMGLNYSLYYDLMRGWHSNLDYRIDDSCGGNDHCRQVVVTRPDGSTLSFQGDGYNSYGNFPEIGGGGLATLTHNTDGTYVLHDEDATTEVFGNYGLQSIADASGIGWTINWNLTTNTETITHTNGQSFTVASQDMYSGGVLTSIQFTVTDPAGNIYSYSENPQQLVTSVTLPGSPSTGVGYKYNGTALTEVDYNGVPHDYTTYATNVITTYLADNSGKTTITYSYPSAGKMTAVVTNALTHNTTKQYTQFTDPSGAGTQYLLASSSEDAVSDCGATINQIFYDSNGYLKQTIDNNHNTHNYQYAANGQLQTETEAYGTSYARTTDYYWDPNQQLNRLKRVVVEGESETDYGYNGQNRLASITRINLSPNGVANQSLTTSYDYTYYPSGMVKTMTVTYPSPGNTDTVTTTYNSLGWPLSIADGLGHTTTYSNYNALGEPLQVTGPNGAVTGYAYDERGRVTSKTIHSAAGAGRWNYYYDGFGLLYQIVAPGGDTTTWNRDAEMRVRTITHNDSTGMSTETLGYDLDNNVNSDVITRGDDTGRSSTALYDGLDRVYKRYGANNQVWTYAYDGNGNVLSVTDALNHTTSYHYDPLNRLSETINAKTGTTYYYYDAGDHLTKVIDPRGLTTTYTWDGLGLLWNQSSPDTGTTTFNYDSYGRLAYKIRADGIPDYFGYDGLNRVTSAGTTAYGSQTFTYDTCTNGLGMLCKVTDAHTTTSYSYTPEGWLSSRDFIVDGIAYSLDYAYDNAGRLATVEYPDGNQANYDYTTGSVSNVSLTVNGTVVDGATNIAYRPMNLAMSAWNSANGLRNVNAYDEDMRLIGIRVPNIQSWDYGYDTANRLTTITDNLDGTLSQTLDYDELDRLKTVTSTADNESYTYDADGNRLTGVINGDHWTWTPSTTSNRMASASDDSWSGSYNYDLQGNLLGTAHPYWTYDSFGRMRTFTPLAGSPVTTYDVNPEGQRLRKYTSLNSTWFAPDVSGTLLAEDQDGTWSDYVWLNGKLVAMIRNGNVYSVHSDQTGRPEWMTSSQKTVIWRAHNYAFDREVTAGQASGFNLGFPGQYFDEESGLYYNGARDYSPGLGRYIESDPVGIAAGINSYIYAGANPISVIDPSGLEGVGPWTYPAGSPDALDYHRAMSGCYDAQAKAFLKWSIIIAATEIALLGPEDPAADAAVAEELALAEEEGATEAEYTLTNTVENNAASRPYVNSPLTIQEIESTGQGVADPGGIPGALRYDVQGTFNGSQGTYQLVIHPETNTVYHFLFTSGG